MQPKHHISLIAVLLILGLVAGPLSAQTVYRCEMMDDAPATSCCCDEPLRCDESDDGAAVETGGCCTVSLELHAGNNFDYATAVVQRNDIRSNVDPPVVAIVEIPSMSPATSSAPSPNRGIPLRYSSGTKTYLTTQRLRI